METLSVKASKRFVLDTMAANRAFVQNELSEDVYETKRDLLNSMIDAEIKAENNWIE